MITIVKIGKCKMIYVRKMIYIIRKRNLILILSGSKLAMDTQERNLKVIVKKCA